MNHYKIDSEIVKIFILSAPVSISLFLNRNSRWCNSCPFPGRALLIGIAPDHPINWPDVSQRKESCARCRTNLLSFTVTGRLTAMCQRHKRIIFIEWVALREQGVAEWL